MRNRGARAGSSLFVLFTTVLVDLIGFGMVIPLVGLYGRHYGASGWELPLLGAIYSLFSFVSAPFWGSLSDRIGRRPVLLISLLGSTSSYLLFAFAPSTYWLIASRALGGIFAGNITAAFAYVADVTGPESRAKGMGMLGAAFGIGFTLGPPVGGIAAAKFGLAAPGLIAAAICGLNFLVAIFRLPESLSQQARTKAKPRSLAPLSLPRLARSFEHPELWYLFLANFLITFAFSNMEQTFSLLFQAKFNFETGIAGFRTGVVLMVSGLTGAVIQGGLIRKLVPLYGERALLLVGIFFNAVTMAVFPYIPTYELYFLNAIPMALGSGLINPSLSSLVSRSAAADEQGEVAGISQGLGALARALGPFVGLSLFQMSIAFPYWLATAIACFLFVVGLFVFSRGKNST